MFDLDKVKIEGEKYTKLLNELLQVELTPEMQFRLYTAALGKDRSEIYRVAVFYGQEGDKCKATGAYFACCLMYASAIEALLALLCLSCRTEVEPLDAYVDFKKGKGFVEKVLSAQFQNYIEVAKKLDWIPSSVVPTELLTAAIQDLPLVLVNLYPGMKPEEVYAKAESFKKNPGLEMLYILQHMRNLVHGPRWPRLGISAPADEFDLDCKFVMVIANQVVFCLFATFSNLAAKRMVEANEMKTKLSPEAFSLVIKQVEAMVAGVPPPRK